MNKHNIWGKKKQMRLNECSNQKLTKKQLRQMKAEKNTWERKEKNVEAGLAHENADVRLDNLASLYPDVPLPVVEDIFIQSGWNILKARQ